jgi:tryptophan-rich sensory protein
MNKYLKLTVSILIPLLIGLAGSFFTSSSVSTWYTTIQKPSFNPPNWIFGPVWTLLYIMIGLSFYFIWVKLSAAEFKLQFVVYSFQLLLNFLWSVLFFGLRNPLLSFIEIVLLWLSILYLVLSFYKLSAISSFLLIPYLLWVTFASILNLSIVILNR